nr:HTH domain-containing protein [Candidatus Njordarchaeota archaeon]
MDKWTFLELARRVLEEEKKPLTPLEIWEIAKKKSYDKYVGTEGKTPWRSIEAQLYVNVRDRKDSPFAKVGTLPVSFYVRGVLTENEAEAFVRERDRHVIVLKPKAPSYLERDLHPFLTYFAFYYLRAYTKTIQHTKSDKKEFGEWVHPDMVGCWFPLDEWKREVLELSKETGNIPVKLYSFEIKRELDFSNLRESFFQAVSNSSWANEGYLVASEVSDDEDFHSNLRRLSVSFGIGVIRLNVMDPDSSEVVYPAKYRETLDWDTINKLASMNPDFMEFVKQVGFNIMSRDRIKERYEKILARDELIESLKK